MTVQLPALVPAEPGRPITADAWNAILESLGLLAKAVNTVDVGETLVTVSLHDEPEPSGSDDEKPGWIGPVLRPDPGHSLGMVDIADVMGGIAREPGKPVQLLSASEHTRLQDYLREAIQVAKVKTPGQLIERLEQDKLLALKADQKELLIERLQDVLEPEVKPDPTLPGKGTGGRLPHKKEAFQINPAEVIAVSTPTKDSQVVNRVIRAIPPFPGRTAHTLTGLHEGQWTLHITAPGHKPHSQTITVPATAPIAVTLEIDGVRMPDLFGQSLSAAKTTLSGCGIRIGSIWDSFGRTYSAKNEEPASSVVLYQSPAAHTVIDPKQVSIRLIVSAKAQIPAEPPKKPEPEPPLPEDRLNRPALNSLSGHIDRYAQATDNKTLYRDATIPTELAAYIGEVQAMAQKQSVETSRIKEVQAKGKALLKKVDTGTNECQDQEELLGYMRRLLISLADAAEPESIPRRVFNRETVVALAGHILEYAQATGQGSMFQDNDLPGRLSAYVDAVLAGTEQPDFPKETADQLRSRGEKLLAAVDTRTTECQDQEELLGYLRRLVIELAEAGKTP
ncbi:MAG: PASTA domain-containing protein [Desulfobulbus sp.]